VPRPAHPLRGVLSGHVPLSLYIYIGEFKKDAKRKLESLCEEIKNGNTDKGDLFERYGATYVRAYRGIAHAIDLVKKPKAYERIQRPKNGIWFGTTGSGKTWDAEQVAIDNGQSMFKVPIRQLKDGWYDGYNGEDIILFDDFRGKSMEPHEFLNLLDGMVRFPVKGGYVENKSSCLFFTSPDHPINWWPKWYDKCDNNWAQVARRLDKVYYCQKESVDKWLEPQEVKNEDANFYKHETVKIN